MTERLGTLLRDEATDLVVPPVRTDLIVGRARRLRRRRRLGRGLVAVVVVGAIAFGLGPIVVGRDQTPAQRHYLAASADDAYRHYGAYATGSTVHIGNHEVGFTEKIKALYYTSEGVLVRMGKRPETDTPGPSHYTLVHPDGTSTKIDLEMGDRVPGTDPDSSVVAYAAPTTSKNRWSLIAVSLVTGKEVGRTTISGAFTWGGWEAPPVTTSGDRMWALLDGGWTEFDWGTGATRVIPGTAGATIDAAHGVYALQRHGDATDWILNDFVTGAHLGTVRIHGDGMYAEFGWLSVDGRYVRLQSDGAVYDGDGKLITPPGASRFVSVETGKSVSVPDRVSYGWTPDGHTLSVDAAHDKVIVCDPGTGACDRIDVPVDPGTVKLGGALYES